MITAKGWMNTAAPPSKAFARNMPTSFPGDMGRTAHQKGAVAQLEFLYQVCERANRNIYLFIDEYDYFTNAILANPEGSHHHTNETYGEDYLRAFFSKVKAGTYSSIKRCFITGVSL